MKLCLWCQNVVVVDQLIMVSDQMVCMLIFWLSLVFLLLLIIDFFIVFPSVLWCCYLANSRKHIAIYGGEKLGQTR